MAAFMIAEFVPPQYIQRKISTSMVLTASISEGSLL